jgi:hypothetical protein
VSEFALALLDDDAWALEICERLAEIVEVEAETTTRIRLASGPNGTLPSASGSPTRGQSLGQRHSATRLVYARYSKPAA